METIAIIIAVAVGIGIVIFMAGFIYEQGLSKGIQITKEKDHGNRLH